MPTWFGKFLPERAPHREAESDCTYCLLFRCNGSCVADNDCTMGHWRALLRSAPWNIAKDDAQRPRRSVALQGIDGCKQSLSGQHWAVAQCSRDRHLEYPAYTAKETPPRPELRSKYSDPGAVSQLIALVEYVGDIKTQLDLPIFW
jgi:hypothetical protein